LSGRLRVFLFLGILVALVAVGFPSGPMVRRTVTAAADGEIGDPEVAGANH